MIMNIILQMAHLQPYHFYIESRHAFRVYLEKSIAEVKGLFLGGIYDTVNEQYEVSIKEDDTALAEELGRLNIVKNQAVEGIISFQLRFQQDDKKIMLLGYAHHNWENPSLNTPESRK